MDAAAFVSGERMTGGKAGGVRPVEAMDGIQLDSGAFRGGASVDSAGHQIEACISSARGKNARAARQGNAGSQFPARMEPGDQLPGRFGPVFIPAGFRSVGSGCEVGRAEDIGMGSPFSRSVDPVGFPEPPGGRPDAADREMEVLFDREDREEVISDGSVVLTCRHFFTLPWDARAKAEQWAEGGAIIHRMAENEYLIAGSGVVVDFKTRTEKQQEQQKKLGEDGFAEAGNNSKSTASKFSGSRLGLLAVDEVSIDSQGQMQYLRRHNGDQSHQGRHARISVGEWKILHIRLYEYE